MPHRCLCCLCRIRLCGNACDGWFAWGAAAPVVSFSSEANAAVTAGYSVTVTGLNFGVGTTTPTATVGLSSCATAAWASTSSVVCLLACGEGVGHELRVTVADVVGTRTAGFSYDGARACHKPNHLAGKSFCFVRPLLFFAIDQGLL